MLTERNVDVILIWLYFRCMYVIRCIIEVFYKKVLLFEYIWRLISNYIV